MKNNIKKTKERISWDEYFMEFAILSSRRSTCLRRSVGAVIVKDNKVISTGYNGAPSGMEHCDKTGCIRNELNVKPGERHELCRGLHAEQNAIIFAAQSGGNIAGGTIYINTQPCSICAKMIINSGIKRVVYLDEYNDNHSLKLLKDAGIKVEKFKK